MHVVQVAAENDALPGGKVGGLGDVIRDLPKALADAGCKATVLTPGYGTFASGPGARQVATVRVRFCGTTEQLTVYEVPSRRAVDGVTQLVLEHPLFSAAGAGRIYVDDNAGPFATDAHKFALFCAGVAETLISGIVEPWDVLHCHDWHAAVLLLLRAYDPAYESLRERDAVYTIHNLSLQGVRPLRGVESALESWFPRLDYDYHALVDPFHSECINLMRTAINLADRVHTVSPTYAREILRPSNWSEGVVGGEGLELDLQRADREERLLGILNGCEYDDASLVNSPTLIDRVEEKVTETVPKNLRAHFEGITLRGASTAAGTQIRNGLRKLQKHVKEHSAEDSAAPVSTAPPASPVWRLMEEGLDSWVMANRGNQQAHYFALRRLHQWQLASGPERPCLVSIGRLTAQKLYLLVQNLGDSSAMEMLLEKLNPGTFIMLGSGDADYASFFTRVMQENRNFLYLDGYSEELSTALYGFGNLFIMPSIYEPCGISQMLAMRAGVPCLVHGVGGLNDTVTDGDNGFSFAGDTLGEKQRSLLSTLDRALSLYHDSPLDWARLVRNASCARFTWDRSIRQYLKQLYRIA